MAPCTEHLYLTFYIAALNISNNLANYISQSLDPGLAEFYEYMELDFGHMFTNMMAQAEAELDSAMSRLQYDNIVELYKALSLE